MHPAVLARHHDLYRFVWKSTATPSGLDYVRSGAWSLISNAAQSTVASFGANAWGVETKGDGSKRLPIRPGYTNLFNVAARDLAFFSGADGRVTTEIPTLRPDGTGSAQRFTQPDATAGIGFQPASSAGTTYALTMWIKAASTTKPYFIYFGGGNITAFGLGTGTATGTWQRVVLRNTFSDNTEVFALNDTRHFGGVISGFDDAGAPASWTEIGATDNYHDLFMWIASRYVCPFTDATVGNSVLSLDGDKVVCANGRFDVTLNSGKLEHAEAAADPTTDQYLLYMSADDNVRFRVSDNKYVLRLAGTDVLASAAKAYSQGHDIGAVRTWSRSDSCGLIVDGETLTTAAQSAIAVPATTYLFSNNGANLFPADLELGTTIEFRARRAA